MDESRDSSGRATFVAMVQTGDLWNGDDPTKRGWLYGTTRGTIFVERKMSPGAMVVADVLRENATQTALVDNHDLVEAFAANRTDDTLYVRILPGRSWRSDHLRDSHRLHATAEASTI